ncbi:DUF6951 family protein [Desulforhopalus sp. 52FAK]
MTTLNVFAGICGFSTKITATDKGGYMAELSLVSECPNWQKIDQIFAGKERNVMAELFKNKETGTLQSEIIDTVLSSIPHLSCPVLSGVLKALEASVGLALPKDATITFTEENS